MKRPNLIVLLSFLLLSACQQPTETLLTGDTQGTTWHLKMVLDGTSANPEEIGTAVAALFRRIDERFSNWREDSELARFNQQETTEWQSLSPEVIQLTRLARVDLGGGQARVERNCPTRSGSWSNRAGAPTGGRHYSCR